MNVAKQMALVRLPHFMISVGCAWIVWGTSMLLTLSMVRSAKCPQKVYFLVRMQNQTKGYVTTLLNIQLNSPSGVALADVQGSALFVVEMCGNCVSKITSA